MEKQKSVIYKFFGCKKKMKELISIIGPEDAEILAMNREIMMRRHEEAK